MFEDTIAERVRPLAQAFNDGGLTRLRVRDGEFEVEFRRAPATAARRRRTPCAPQRAGAGASRRRDPRRCRRGRALLAAAGRSREWRVDGDRELAFVETLGIRNPVRSRGPGRIAMIYVTDGQPVEYGQPLFAIER